jgi:hypothetical protein
LKEGERKQGRDDKKKRKREWVDKRTTERERN